MGKRQVVADQPAASTGTTSFIGVKLIERLIEKFVPKFVPGSEVVYANDSSPNFNEPLMKELGIATGSRQNMPDVMLYHRKRNWLLVVDSASGNGPINEGRLEELAHLFDLASPDLIYVTAFQSRSNLADHDELPAWGTHAWFADEPDHMMHFDGSRFMGPR